MFKKVLSIAKYPLVFTTGMVFHHYYEDNRHNKSYKEIKTPIFQDFIQQNNLQTTLMYDIYKSINNFDQFFEKLILKQSNGCQFFEIYISPQLKDVARHEKKIEEVKDLNSLKLSCIFSPNPQIQGHFGIVHGGFTATLLDNLFGYIGTLSHQLIPCATGNLDIKFNKPLFVNSEYLVNCYVEEQEGRKIKLKADIIDKKGRTCVEASATMVRVKWDLRAWQFLFNNLKFINQIEEKIKSNFNQQQQQQQQQN